MSPLPPPSARQARLIWLALSGLAIAVLAALVVALVWALGRILDLLSPVLWPLAVAGVLAYLLDPVVDFIETKGATRTRALVYVFSVALVIVAGLFSLIVPQVVHQGRELVASIPGYAQHLQSKAEHWVEHPPALLKGFLKWETAPPTAAPPAQPDTNQGESMTATNAAARADTTGQVAGAPTRPATGAGKGSLQTATGLAAEFLPKVGSWLFGQVSRVASWFGVLAGLALIPVYTFYFLLEKRGISSHWTDYLPVRDSAFKEELVFVLNSINNYLIAFFRGQVLVAICDGILYGLGFLLIGLPYALLIGVAAMALTIIPFIGAITVCTTALIIAVVQYGDWVHPLMVACVFATVQMLEGLVISPKIMGNRVGLHPVTIIIAVMAGTTLLGGLLGGILALPLTAALRVLMFRYVWKKRAQDECAAGKAA